METWPGASAATGRESGSPFDRLPTELLVSVLAAVPCAQRHNVVPLVCRQWRDVCRPPVASDASPLDCSSVWADITVDGDLEAQAVGAAAPARTPAFNPAATAAATSPTAVGNSGACTGAGSTRSSGPREEPPPLLPPPPRPSGAPAALRLDLGLLAAWLRDRCPGLRSFAFEHWTSSEWAAGDGLAQLLLALPPHLRSLRLHTPHLRGGRGGAGGALGLLSARFSSLEHLTLSRLNMWRSTDAQALCGSIGALTTLRSLALGVQCVCPPLPASLSSLARLTALRFDAVRCELWDQAEWQLPDWITAMVELQVLELLRVPLRCFPGVVTRLPALRVLRIRKTGSELLPAQGLLLPDEQLAALGQSLRELDVGGAAVACLPADLSCLTCLTSLDASSCYVHHHHHHHHHPLHLTHVDGGGTSDGGGHHSMTQMEALESGPAARFAAVDGARVQALPPALSALTQLCRLRLAGVQLCAASLDALAGLRCLQELDLGGCGITRLPSSMSALCRLQRLSLAANHLRRVPPVLTRLTSLTWLDARDNEELEVDDVMGDDDVNVNDDDDDGGGDGGGGGDDGGIGGGWDEVWGDGSAGWMHVNGADAVPTTNPVLLRLPDALPHLRALLVCKSSTATSGSSSSSSNSSAGDSRQCWTLQSLSVLVSLLRTAEQVARGVQQRHPTLDVDALSCGALHVTDGMATSSRWDGTRCRRERPPLEGPKLSAPAGSAQGGGGGCVGFGSRGEGVDAGAAAGSAAATSWVTEGRVLKQSSRACCRYQVRKGDLEDAATFGGYVLQDATLQLTLARVAGAAATAQ